MDRKIIIGIVVAAIVASAIAYYIMVYRKKKEGMSLGESHTFNPKEEETYYFQGMPPSLKVENNYHKYMKEMCKGNYNDLKCRQKAYLKTMKDGTYDKVDLMCAAYKNDEDKYYECLDSTYGNNLWMDEGLNNTGAMD